MTLNEISKLLSAAYENMVSDNFEFDFVVGCIAEALAIADGDSGSFDNQENRV